MARNRKEKKSEPVPEKPDLVSQKEDIQQASEEADRKNLEQLNRGGDANPDPITGEPGSHPVGTGIGGVGGGTFGALLGSAAGPVGSLVGAAIGAIVGGLFGRSFAEMIDPTVEHAYWQRNWRGRPYVREGEEFEHYEPAYRYGWESRIRHPQESFEQAEPRLEQGWNEARGSSRLEWSQAREACRDAWGRVEWTVCEFEYWRNHFHDRPYVREGMAYIDYEPAYRLGVQAHSRFSDRSFDAIEHELRQGWESTRGASTLSWDEARPAIRDAWDRASRETDERQRQAA